MSYPDPYSYSMEPSPDIKVSKLPPVALGYVFAVLFWVASLFDLQKNPDAYFGPFSFAVHLGSMVFWFFCLHRLHLILKQITDATYPVSPGMAVGFHFIPVLNLWWLVKWPMDFSRFMKADGRVGVLPGLLLGFYLLVSTVLRFLDGGLSIILIMSLGLYLRNRLGSYLMVAGHLERPTDFSPKARRRWVKPLAISTGSILGIILVVFILIGVGVETGRLPELTPNFETGKIIREHDNKEIEINPFFPVQKEIYEKGGLLNSCS